MEHGNGRWEDATYKGLFIIMIITAILLYIKFG